MMIRRDEDMRLMLTMGCLAMMLATPGAAQPTSAPVPPKDPKVEDDLLRPPDVTPEWQAQIERWIAELGSPSATMRQAAEDRLIEAGPRALYMLWKAYRQSRDFEVRLRIEAIVRELYMDARLYLRNAFLGISIHERILTHNMDARVPKDGDGIVVRDVVRDTAAEKAGLREGDVIIRVDGESVRLSPVGADSTSFTELLRRKPIGSTVNLTVLRRDETRQFRVTLRPRPRELYSPLHSPTLAAQKSRTEAEFFGWWEENFLMSVPPEAFDQWVLPSPAPRTALNPLP